MKKAQSDHEDKNGGGRKEAEEQIKVDGRKSLKREGVQNQGEAEEVVKKVLVTTWLEKEVLKKCFGNLAV